MKKITVFILLSLMVFAFGNEELIWTITECKHPGIHGSDAGYYYADYGRSDRLGKLRYGSKVTPIKRTPSAYQVRFSNGEMGWISWVNIKEAHTIEITDECNLYSLYPSTHTTNFDDVITILPEGEIVTLYAVGPQGAFLVKTSKGKRGSVMQNCADAVTDKMLPEYSKNLEYQFFFKEELDELTLGTSTDSLEKILGIPAGVTKSPSQFIWHYDNVEVFYDSLRYSGVKTIVKNDVVISHELQGEGYLSFVDKLPFYLDIKRNQKLKSLSYVSEDSMINNIKEQHWALQILLRILQILLIVLMITLAMILSLQAMNLFAFLKFLPNTIVLLLSYLANIALHYFYFLILTAHFIIGSYMITAVILFVTLVIAHKRIKWRIRYQRCPKCRTMWTARSRGSKVIGKRHYNENYSDTVGSSEVVNGNKRINTYTTYNRTKRKTAKTIRDYQSCQNCGYNWGVDRVETVDGHV